ncbi:MAG: DUF4242 domain-containing protein [Deinococcota bacterium]|nr:DUF4242 domain-containing protein [Deinococcota bacterium]
MPRYLLFRTVGELTDEDIKEGSLQSLAVLDEMPSIRWIRSYYSAEEGKIYCEYEAASIELLFEHARRAGIPLERAVVVRELEPAMFR